MAEKLVYEGDANFRLAGEAMRVEGSGVYQVYEESQEPPQGCVLSEWSEPELINTTPCVDGQQTLTYKHTRYVVIEPADGGEPCGPLEETFDVVQACTAPPEPMPEIKQAYFTGEELSISYGSSTFGTWKYTHAGDLEVPYINEGGDWSDMDGVLQGRKAWGSTAFTKNNLEQTLEIDVTELFNRYLNGSMQHRGQILRLDDVRSTCRIFTHNTSKPPTLEFAEGVTLKAKAISMSSSSQVGQPSASTIVLSAVGCAGLYFDIRAFAAQHQLTAKATLRVYVDNDKQFGSGASTVALYPIDMERHFDPVEIRYGLAADHYQDEGLESKVLRLETFRDANLVSRGIWQYIPGMSVIVPDGIAPGVNAFRMTVPTGQNLGEDARDLLWSNYGPRDWNNDGRIIPEPTELWIRAYCICRNLAGGGKFPVGYDWTFNTAMAGENPVNGNPWFRSGLPAGAGNGGAPCNGKNGGSARGGWAAPGDQNSLDRAEIYGLHHYFYHADMTGDYGDYMPWRKSQLGLVRKDQLFCLDQHIAFNSLEDDGTGRKDGILEAWINGRLAYSKTNCRMRNWPGNWGGADNIRLYAVWLNSYYGGKGLATEDCVVDIGNLVVAQQYIGPTRGIVLT